MRSFPIAVAAFLVTTILLAPSIPLQVSANPITIAAAASGNFFCFSSNVSMPEATVNISLICRNVAPTESSGPSFTYEMNMQSSFIIQSESSLNTTIAFAYPGSWSYYGFIESGNEPQFLVNVNGTAVPITILDFYETGFNPEELEREDWDEWGFLWDHQFVLFNVTLQEMKATSLEVHVNMELANSADEFWFSYSVGTARAWNGETLEEVRITLQNTSRYISSSFNPEDSLTITEDVDKKTGVWTLDFSSFAEDSVGVSISQKRWPYTPIQNPEDYSLLLGVAGIAAAGVIAIAIVWRIKCAGG